MVGQSAAAKTWGNPFRDTAEQEAQAAIYGGLVGTMLEELEARLADPDASQIGYETPVDSIHRVSVASGYVGLIMGFTATVWIISHYFS